jgi:hypothetical protein
VTEDAFWMQYSDSNGERLKYKAILEALKVAQIKNNERDAKHAKTYFGDDLTRQDTKHIFMYRKSGRMHVMTRNDKIAQAWRDLLKQDTELELH